MKLVYHNNIILFVTGASLVMFLQRMCNCSVSICSIVCVCDISFGEVFPMN